jgi:16S rRNA (guanine527-N7)-methyltransferase
METQIEEFRGALAGHAASFGIELQPAHLERLVKYYELVLKWNPRLHLVAPCSPEDFAVRHILESLLLLKFLPVNAPVADVGSGAGLPIVPCLLVRDDLHGLLIESSRRKTAFLKECFREFHLSGRATLLTARFEEVATPEIDFVTCRALDKFSELLPELIAWAPAHAKLLLFVGEVLRGRIAALVGTERVERIPLSEKRFLIIANRPDTQIGA